MCFRPADVGGPTGIDCPECGKHIQPIGGVMLPTCPFCDTDLTAAIEAATSPAAPAPGVPAAPAAPGAPAAPAAPGVPSAAVPPTAASKS